MMNQGSQAAEEERMAIQKAEEEEVKALKAEVVRIAWAHEEEARRAEEERKDIQKAEEEKVWRAEAERNAIQKAEEEEEARRAEEERKAIQKAEAEEEARRAEEERTALQKASEERRAEEKRKVIQKAHEEEARRAEQKRKAIQNAHEEDLRRADEKRKAIQQEEVARRAEKETQAIQKANEEEARRADEVRRAASRTHSAAVAATGDPHLQNVYGERFDLMRPGRHVLIHVPRGERVENTLLRVEADARQMGEQCTPEMYFQELNITGAWAEAKRTGGLHFHAEDALGEKPNWEQFGEIELKVSHGRTQKGIQYLNLYVKHLRRAGFAVGGLLGLDDHTLAAKPWEECLRRRVALLSMVQIQNEADQASDFSIAEASF